MYDDERPTHRPGMVTRARVRRVSGSAVRDRRDDLATEEPLEIRLQAGGESRTVAITMRTPGADFELAAGFLYGEGVIGPGDIAAIGYCTDADLTPEERYNTVTVRLNLPALPDIATLERHFMTSSACGVCGAATLGALRDRCPSPVAAGSPAITVTPRVLYDLPHLLRKAQSGFGRTGGLHAAGLFTPAPAGVRADGVREDVGRHNAVDKLIGSALLGGRLPLDRQILLVSGRASYEIMQKAVTAGVQIVCAVSAPSSLAVDVAREFGVTLVGFLREERFNIYSGADRIATGDREIIV